MITRIFSSRLKRINEMSITDYFQDINPEEIMAYNSKESTIQKIKSVLKLRYIKMSNKKIFGVVDADLY